MNLILAIPLKPDWPSCSSWNVRRRRGELGRLRPGVESPADQSLVRESFAPRRRWSDRLPVIGWLGLRREAALHGAGFWVRPMVVEILIGVALAALYWWETAALGLLPPAIAQPWNPSLQARLHQQFVAHILLGFDAGRFVDRCG